MQAKYKINVHAEWLLLPGGSNKSEQTAADQLFILVSNTL